jgi:hypothetical protein
LTRACRDIEAAAAKGAARQPDSQGGKRGGWNKANGNGNNRSVDKGQGQQSKRQPRIEAMAMEEVMD